MSWFSRQHQDVFLEYKLDLNSTKLTIEGRGKKFLVPYSVIKLFRETKDDEQEIDLPVPFRDNFLYIYNMLKCTLK